MKFSNTLSTLARLGVAAIGFTTVLPAVSQMSQSPMLTKGTPVAPNIVFVLDDSGSMGMSARGIFLFQENLRAAWGVTGGGRFTPATTDGVNPYADAGSVAGRASLKIAQCSPDINQLYYNPAILYLPPLTNDGVTRVNTTSDVINWGGGAMPQTDITIPVCRSGSDPILYRYKNTYTGTNPGTASGKGPPYWDGVTRLDLAASYTTTTLLAGTNYPKASSRTDCTTVAGQCTGTEELVNFRNWSNYYRDRSNMATSAVIEAFAAQAVDGSFRLGWGDINNLGISTTSSRKLTSGVQSFTASTRTNFINWLNTKKDNPGNRGTPNTVAVDSVGRYYKRTDADGPWGTTPKASSVGIVTVGSPTSTEAQTAYAQCRRSNAILLTDGYNNSGTVSVNNVDGGTLPSVTSPTGGTLQPYNPIAAPYKDTHPNTMADVAMLYWGTDLMPNPVQNRVSKVPGVDDAVWQHMNFWAIGLGLDGTLDQTLYPNLTAQKTITWPAPVDNTPTAIDDTWHATINGRGGFLNAADPRTLTGSLSKMISQILKSSSSQAGVAVSTVNLTNGTKKYVPVYTTGEWSGNMVANTLDPVSGNETGISWQAETRDPVTGAETSNTLYPDLSVPYASRIVANRNIAVGNSSGAVDFTYSAMNTAGIASQITPAFSGQIVDATLINYLRGDRTQEGTGTAREYRVRQALMGDIVNSTPTFVKTSIDYGYGSLNSYSTFLTTKAGRTEGALFVGANDGMLHVLAENDGREIFAFVPRATLPRIAQLADPNYAHRYFVDGPITQGDFFNGTDWKNVVVGTTGGGVADSTSPFYSLKSVFAIDATTPTTLTKSNVLWELASDVQTELGHVLSDVQIGLMRNGQWAAIFGNGYKSSSGKAQLFIVNMTNGSVIRRIDTQPSTSSDTNGLGGVRLVRDDNNVVIGAYAGDLRGNMWKFDLSDASASNWASGYGTSSAPVPLYTAKDSGGGAQPITAAPLILKHPSGGYLVAFGTGKFFEDTDINTTNVQTVYGIRDPVTFGTVPSPNPTVSKLGTVDRSLAVGAQSLVKQTIAADIVVSRTITAFDDTTSTQNVTYYTVSTNPITWTGALAKDGWYFDQPNSGQRTVFPVDTLVASIARVDTIVPKAIITTDPCIAPNTGRGYNYIIDVLTGGSPLGPILDTNGDGTIGVGDDTTASGYSTAADGRDISMITEPTLTCVAPKVRFVILSSTGESIVSCIDPCSSASPPASCSPPPTANSAIRRTWRQLFMR